jgi:hypothetical protein
MFRPRNIQDFAERLAYKRDKLVPMLIYTVADVFNPRLIITIQDWNHSTDQLYGNIGLPADHFLPLGEKQKAGNIYTAYLPMLEDPINEANTSIVVEDDEDAEQKMFFIHNGQKFSSGSWQTGYEIVLTPIYVNEHKLF